MRKTLSRYTQKELKCIEHSLIHLFPLDYQNVRESALKKTRLRLRKEEQRAK